MGKSSKPSARYLETLLEYYEVAAQAIEPLLEKYALIPKDEAELRNLGQSYIEIHQSYSWSQFMTHVVERYPGYLDDFTALEQMAPPEDLPALNILTEHEVAVIDFAEKELRGDPDSLVALHRYLE